MKNLWDELKAFKCRPWSEVKLFPSNNKNGKVVPPPKMIVEKPDITFETLPEEDRNIYGSHPKTDVFFLERCRTCSRLLKPCIRDIHQASCTRINGAALAKKNTHLPPSKKKKTKRSNKSTSGEDSESIISSENSSPALDSLEVQVNDSSATSIRDDSMIDVIAIEEIVSEDSKPPTPGPQDLYEEFASPLVEDTSSSFSSALESSDSSKFKPALKLKIIASNSNQRSHGTSLLEAHLLSNTKYNTSSGISNVIVAKNPTLKRAHPTSLLEQAILKSEDDQSNTSSKLISFSKKLKTDTKVSIPISLLPQTVKMSPVLVKKPNTNLKTVLSKTNLQKLVNAKDRTIDPRPFNVVAEETNDAKASTAEGAKGKAPARSRKNKRSKGRGRTSKTVEFDPDRHCGVLLDENRRCMRSLTCKTHSMALRRSVEGRSKNFDSLLADHRASKEALKDQDRLQSLNLSEPVISIPLLAVDNIAGSTIQIPASKSNPEVVRVRVANLPSSSENQKLQLGGELLKGKDDEKVLFKKSTAKISTMSALSAALSSKSPNSTVHRVLSNGNSPTVVTLKPVGRKLQLYDNNLKVSFVCSDMLYKVGGLLYTDRSRQSVRKCVIPLTSNGARLKVTPLKQVQCRRKISDFLNSVKNPPIKLSLAGRPNAVIFAANSLNQNQPRSSEETIRMQNLLASSGKVLGSLSTDENELRKLKITRVKRSADEGGVQASKRVKLDSMSDENYDINTLLSFDKSLLNKTSNDVPQIPIITPDDLLYRPGKEVAKFTNPTQPSATVQVPYNVVTAGSGARVGIGSTNFQEGNTQLWQTFQDMESEIISTVGVDNIQELYSTQPLANDGNAYQSGYLNADTVYQENDIVEETISKNYSLLEEYCKNITTDELLSDGKGNYGYYESGSTPLAGGSGMKLNKNGASVINEHLYTNIGNQSTAVGNSISMPQTDFDAQILTSYLTNVTSENGAPARNMNVNNIGFIGGDQFSTIRLDTPNQGQILPQEHVYEEILTLNKPFQGQF